MIRVYRVKAVPLVISTGYYFILMCGDEEVVGFKYEDDADKICDLLNSQDELIGEITKSLLYCIDNERSYGDEYTADVLNDIVEQFKLRERI